MCVYYAEWRKVSRREPLGCRARHFVSLGSILYYYHRLLCFYHIYTFLLSFFLFHPVLYTLFELNIFTYCAMYRNENRARDAVVERRQTGKRLVTQSGRRCCHTLATDIRWRCSLCQLENENFKNKKSLQFQGNYSICVCVCVFVS